MAAGARRRQAEDAARHILAGYDVAPCLDPVAALASLAGEILAFKGLLAERAGELEGIAHTDRAGHEEVRATLAAYERGLDRCASVLVAMARLNLDDRLVRITEAQGAMIVSVIRSALDRAALPAEWREPVLDAIATELRAADA